jgi:hypothetical protein
MGWTVGPEASGRRDRLRGSRQWFPGVMAQLSQQGADQGMRGTGGEGGLLRRAIEAGKPGVEA